jgi:hypothetical protein
VGISRARAAVILADPNQGKLADARSTLVAVAIERANPHVNTVMELIASHNRIHLKGAEVNEVVCLGELAEKLIAQSCITPGVKNIFEHLLSSNGNTNQIFVRQIPEKWSGKTYREVVREAIDGEVPLIVCGFVTNSIVHSRSPVVQNRAPDTRVECEDDSGYGFTGKTIVLNPRAGVQPGKDTRLTPEDRLIVIAFQPPMWHNLSDLRVPAPRPDEQRG